MTRYSRSTSDSREQLGTRPIEDLIDLPLMKDADRRATIDVLSKLMLSGIDQITNYTA